MALNRLMLHEIKVLVKSSFLYFWIMIQAPLRKFWILFLWIGILSECRVEAMVQRDTTIRINNTLVDLKFPLGEIKGTILMLPGWNFSRSKTCEHSSFCSEALKQGFVLICPEMGKSLYASSIYPETRKDWALFPQLKFITDTLQPYVRLNYNLLKEGQSNFIYGISTGARGGALIVENTGKLYGGAALLSGDYNQCQDTSDNLMKGFYGSYTRYKSRWEGPDNPSLNVSKIKCPVYLGHGKNDKVVPFQQTLNLFEKLKKEGSFVTFSQKEGMGHDFNFWAGETGDVLLFFKKNMQH